jgi:hypothetical protein
VPPGAERVLDVDPEHELAEVLDRVALRRALASLVADHEMVRDAHGPEVAELVLAFSLALALEPAETLEATLAEVPDCDHAEASR